MIVRAPKPQPGPLPKPPTEKPEKARQKALARWEGEGGALGPPQPKSDKASGTDGKVSVKKGKKGSKK